MRHAELSVSRDPRASVRRARIVLALVMATCGIAAAQSTGGLYTLAPQRIAAGGGRATGGAFELEGTIAQHEASAISSGGALEIAGGFHRRAANAPLGTAIFGSGFEGP